MLELKQRANAMRLPIVKLVDMRNELQKGNISVLSTDLSNNIVEIINKNEQAIILLNRRGYSTFVNCRDCGESITCPHCAVSLVYHSTTEELKCHYCGTSISIPKTCPSCKSKRIKFFGTGTQKSQIEIGQI